MNEIEAVGAEALLQPSQGGAAEKARPWLYSLMIAPSAVLMNGVVQGGVLAYILSQRGVGSKGQSHLIYLLALPTSLYFLWSPITDFFVRRRTWLLLGGVSGGALMALGLTEKNLQSTSAVLLMLLGACCSQLVVSSCGGMMGTVHSVQARRTA